MQRKIRAQIQSQWQLFWTIITKKTKCGKTGATDESFFIILQQKSHVQVTTNIIE